MIKFRQGRGRPHSFPREINNRMIRVTKQGRRVRMKQGQVAMEIACCDCCLVHLFKLTIKRDKVWLVAWREEQTTEIYRKQKNIRFIARRKK